MSGLAAEERDAFYRAAVLGLRALDAQERTPRRFGPDADARWTQFAGSLGPTDRLDILLRDAAVTWGAAFSPAKCFGFFGLADDEPFGPDWSGIPDGAARAMLAGDTPSPTLENVARVLGMTALPTAVPRINPATRMVVVGGAAVLAVANAFAGDQSLSWSDQVAVMSSNATVRQLAGIAAVLVGARRRTVVVRPNDSALTTLRQAGFGHVDVVVASPDAEADAAGIARALGGV